MDVDECGCGHTYFVRRSGCNLNCSVLLSHIFECPRDMQSVWQCFYVQFMGGIGPEVGKIDPCNQLIREIRPGQRK